MRMSILATLVVFGLTSCAEKPVTDIPGEEIMSNKAKVIQLLNSIESGDTKPVEYIHPKTYIQHNLQAADGVEGFGALLEQLDGTGKVRVVRAYEDGDFVFTHSEYDFFGPKVGFDIFRFEDGLIVEHWDNLQDLVSETVSGRSQTDGPKEAVDLENTEMNKALVGDFVQEVFLGGQVENITDYISAEKYHQHNPMVADGLEGLGAALAALAEAGTPMIYQKNHMILGEGNFVLAVSEGQFLGKNSAFYDLFRVEDGLIVEHWDTIQEIPPQEQWLNQNGKF
jgi:predicted SnoaL-like aldol condensation-catalyzing enzyme